MTQVISGAERPTEAVRRRPSPFARLLRGRTGDPPWARPALLALLAATAVLYMWGLGASGWANTFYSAAVQAGTRSWKAFFFGSSDAANFITVDKTPMALWPMDLSARIFGLSSWSVLVPQALMGVASVAVLYATVRRSLGGRGDAVAAAGGLLAGALLATTPVAALMFRFNNPDALLTLLLTVGAYALLRARERASTRWLLLAAACVGLAFLAKMLQAFLVVPAFALVYLATAAPPRESGAPGTAGDGSLPAARGAGAREVFRRLGQLAAAGVVMVAAAGWWVVAVMLVPGASRPYIGGSQHDSVLELAFGYNGLGRLSGNESGGLGNTNQDAGWGRLFGPELGGQIGWLLPAALVLLAAGLYVTWGRRRQGDDRAARAADPAAWAGFALWGGWLLVTGAVFSFMQGIFHPYYAVALAPAVAAIVGMGGAVLWRRRRNPVALGTLAVTVALTAWWSFTLLGRAPGFHAWLRPSVLSAGLVAAGLLATAAVLLGRATRAEAVARGAGGAPDPDDGPAHLDGIRSSTRRTGVPAVAVKGVARRWTLLAGTGAAVAVATSLAGPTAYAVDTAATPQHGAIPFAGPVTAGPGGMRGFGGRFRNGFPSGAFRRWTGGGLPGGNGGGFPGGPGGPGGATGNGGGTGTAPGPGNAGGTGGGAGKGTTGGAGNAGAGTSQAPGGSWPFPGGGFAGPGGTGGTGRAGRAGGLGGLLDAPVPGAALTRLLRQGAGSYTWVAATVGSNNAAGYQLATGDPVMAIGGFNGTDPAPTLSRFQEYVRTHRVHYFVDRSVMGGFGRRGASGSGDADQIAAWVRQNFTASTVDGTTIYDLSHPA